MATNIKRRQGSMAMAVVDGQGIFPETARDSERKGKDGSAVTGSAHRILPCWGTFRGGAAVCGRL